MPFPLQAKATVTLVLIVFAIALAVFILVSVFKKNPLYPAYPAKVIAQKDSIISADEAKIKALEAQKVLIQQRSDSILSVNADQQQEIDRINHSVTVLQRQKQAIVNRINNKGFNADSVLQAYQNY